MRCLLAACWKQPGFSLLCVSLPITSDNPTSMENSRLHSRGVVFKSDQALVRRPLLSVEVKVKANFPSIQSNKLWVASVVELTSARVILLPVRHEPNGNLSGGGPGEGRWRGGGCAEAPYGEQRYNEQLHLLAWTQRGSNTKLFLIKYHRTFMGLGTCWAWL